MKRFMPIFCLAAFVLGIGALAPTANAEGTGMPLGQEIRVSAPFCVTLESMTEVAKTDSESGPEAAMAVLDKKTDCGFGAGYLTIRRVVSEWKTKRGATVSVLEVQITNDKIKITDFMIADSPIDKGQKT